MSGRHSRFPAVNRDVPAAERASSPEADEPKLAAAPEPEPTPEPVAEPEATADAGVDNGYPTDGSIAAVLEWVGEDEGRADYALAAETAKEHPRKGILDALAG